jgi:large subunit ribosomal protein L4
MPNVDVLSLSLERKGAVSLDDRFFGVPIKTGLLHEAVQMQLANRRQGTASTKTRGEVRGGGKKPWRQKGTGRARAGSIRSPLWRGGGTVFGPLPRSYQQGFPRRKSRAALYAALTAKVQDGTLKVLEDLSLPEPKTRALASMLKGLQLKGKVLILLEGHSTDFKRAAQNLPGVTVQDLGGLNVYDVLRHDHLLVRRQDLDTLQQRWVKQTDTKY